MSRKMARARMFLWVWVWLGTALTVTLCGMSIRSTAQAVAKFSSVPAPDQQVTVHAAR